MATHPTGLGLSAPDDEPTTPVDDGRRPARERIHLRHRPSDMAGRRRGDVVPATVPADEQAREGRT